MGYSVGWDSNWKRDIGYGVPSICDHPGCTTEIDRGLGYVCGSGPYGGEHGCGLFFCGAHLASYTRRTDVGGPRLNLSVSLCERCGKKSKKGPFEPTADTLEWMEHKLGDPSWAQWREHEPEAVKRLLLACDALRHPKVIEA